MNEAGSQVLARCEECDHAFRVPHGDRSYTCKECGGTVRATPEAKPKVPVQPVKPSDPEPVVGSIACQECDAINPGGLQFCDECGASLEPSLPRPGSDAHVRLRQDSSEALRRAHVMIHRLAAMYRIGAVAYAVATVFAVLALADPSVPPNEGLLVVGLTTLLCVMLLTAALHILFEPFVWTCVIAVVATTVSVVHFFGVDPLGIASLGSAAWAVLAWAALVPTLHSRRLIAHHKDLYILHHASMRTRRSLKGHTAHERHERLVERMHRAARRAWMLSTPIAIAVILASALGASLALSNLRPRELAPSVAEFEAAWAAADLDAMSEMFDPGVQAAETARLGALLTGHGLRSTPSSLGGAEQAEDGDRAVFSYEVRGVPVTATWRPTGSDWRLVEVTLPVPPIEPVLERFVEAWESSDPVAIASFFAPDAREDMEARIISSRDKRGWERFPAVMSTELEPGAGWSATAVLDFLESELRTDWHFANDGHWRLYGMKMPTWRR